MRIPIANPKHSIRTMRFYFIVLTILGCAGFMIGSDANAGSVSREYFEQLRRRQLFNLAEGYCIRKLADDKLSESDRADLTLELSRTFAEHALYSSGQEAGDLWKRARETVDRFLTTEPSHPKRILMDVQSALIPASQAESLRWQSELNPLDTKRKSEALGLAAAVVSKLTALEQTLAERVRRTRTARPEAMQPFELRTLLDTVRYRLGNALLGQSKLLETTSPDRADALLTATDWLGKVSGASMSVEMSLNSKLLLAEIARIQNDLKRARATLKEVDDAKPRRNIRDRAMAERIRIMNQENRYTDAAEALIAYRRKYQMMSGELRYLNAIVILNLWRTAKEVKNEELASQLLQQFEVHVARAIEHHGGYWGERCRLLQESMQSNQSLGAGLAAAIQQAKQFYSAGRIDDAMDAYGKAVEEAQAKKLDDLAGNLAFIRGSILVRESNYVKAADAFREHTQSFPIHKRRASAHLLWVYCLGKLYDEQATANRREAYTEALTEHRHLFKGSPTANEATWMLARLEERRLQITKALDLYKQIPVEHLRGKPAQAATARCYEMILARLRELKQSTAEWEAAAIRHLAKATNPFLKTPKTLDTEQSETVLRLARIYLNRQTPGYSAAEVCLGRVFDSWEQVQADANGGAPMEREKTWKWLINQATQLRIVSLAGQGNSREAQQLVERLSRNSADEVLAVLDGLMPLIEGADQQTRWQIGDLQLSASSGLLVRQDELTSEQQTRLAHCLGQAYLATDQSSKALEVYSALLDDSPRDKKLARTVADLLMKCESQECYRKAKVHWRTLLNSEKDGSQEWLEIRYQEALCCFKLGEFEECRKLLQVTRILYPNNGDKEIRSQIAKLQADATKR